MRRQPKHISVSVADTGKVDLGMRLFYYISYVHIGNLELAGILERITTWLQCAHVVVISSFLGSHIWGAPRRSSQVGRMG